MTWGAATNRILALCEHLVAEQVTLVVMEATGDYWKSFYYLLEDAGFEVMLLNARQVKNLRGRKSDPLDAVWLCKVAERQMLRPSFVPSKPIRRLRDLTRYRMSLVADVGCRPGLLDGIQPVAFLLADLGVTKSHSRPHCSNDKPFSEAQFKTLKYRPDSPDRVWLHRRRPIVLRHLLPLVTICG